MIELYENLSRKDVELCALVLDASSIPYRIRRQTRGWSIRVDERHYLMARHAMSQYFSENRAEGAFGVHSAEVTAPHGYAGIWTALFLGMVHMGVGNRGEDRALWREFGASAERITGGEFYRAVTALMLHADAAHLVGNMAGIALFGTVVCRIAGWGVGILLILMSGVLGNLINAFMYESAHLSIGASTAVFGAVGILSGHRFVIKSRTGKRQRGAWLPLAGGVALLGLLGTGEHVDLGAHLFGFIAGVLIGAAYARADFRPAGTNVQWTGLAIAAGLVLAAWGFNLAQ